MEFSCINIGHFVLKVHDMNEHCILIKLTGLGRFMCTIVTAIKPVKK